MGVKIVMLLSLVGVLRPPAYATAFSSSPPDDRIDCSTCYNTSYPWPYYSIECSYDVPGCYYSPDDRAHPY